MKRVVVVDDEYIVVAGITAILQRINLDYKIVGSASNGKEGVEIIRQEHPDLVFTDIRMPGLDGLSMIEEVREEFTHTKFCVISGYTDFEYARRALLLKVENYLDKPITIEKVRTCLQKMEVQEDNKKNSLNMQDEIAINALIFSDGDKFQIACREYFMLLKRERIGFNQLKEKSYKFFCVIIEILAGQRKKYDDTIIIPCTDFMQIESVDELEKFFFETIRQIMTVLEMDQIKCSHKTIQKLLQYINDNYDRDIGLTELADQVNLNPAYLSLLFKENVGMSYVKYITNIRVKRAKDLLKQGEKVSEVSAKVGYNNYRYFCEIFKKNEGITPNEFKNAQN